MIRRPPRSTQSRSSAASDVYKRQAQPRRRRSRQSQVDRLGRHHGRPLRRAHHCSTADARPRRHGRPAPRRDHHRHPQPASSRGAPYGTGRPGQFRTVPEGTTMNRSISKPAGTFAVLAVASLALTGCGREADTNDPGPGAGAAIDDIAATGTIDVWAMGTEGEELGAFVEDFEKENPDAEVNVTAVPWEAAHDKIANAITAGETPDVSLIGTTWMGEFAEAGGLEPTPEGLVEESDFYEGAWDSTVVGDTSYGVPWFVETRALYYRTDLAEKAGWDQAPQTWDELKQFATDLEEKAGAEYGISLQPGQTGSWQTVLPFAWSNGAEVTNDDGTEYTIDSPETTEALEYYKSFFDEGLAETRTQDVGELEIGFAEGKYASFISGPWYSGLVEDQGLSPDKYTVAPLPGKDSAPGTCLLYTSDAADDLLCVDLGGRR